MSKAYCKEEQCTLYNENFLYVCITNIPFPPCSFCPTITHIDVLASIKLEELFALLLPADLFKVTEVQLEIMFCFNAGA